MFDGPLAACEKSDNGVSGKRGGVWGQGGISGQAGMNAPIRISWKTDWSGMLILPDGSGACRSLPDEQDAVMSDNRK
jgi:hypothetical protein